MDDEIEEGMVVDDDVQAVADNDQQRERKPEKSPHELLKESKGSVEEIVAQILSVKRQGLPKAELRELVTQMFVHFVTLRQVNRSILLEEDRVKSETERAKAPVDFATLQLHNLMYEKSHYIKAIKTCKDFKSKYPDIELVPEEEFFRDAPEEIKGSVTANEAHDLMLRRLNFELFQRKELCKLHEQLEQRKKVLEEGIANRKKFLSSLPSHLKSLRKASLPVQNQLGIQHTKKMKQHNLAELLPPPLYVIYSQLMAQREAFEENIELEIVGSLKDAQAFVRQQANKDSGSSNLESSKMEDDAPDDEDDGQRRRKRSKNVPAKENIELSGLYQIHPLKVILHVFDDEASDPKPAKLVTLKFEHMPKLNVVTVGIEGSNEGPQDNILCNLFPDDTGRDLPHQSAKLAIGDSLSFDQRTSRPYKWVQHLAGIDFLPEMPPLLSDHETSSTDITRTDVVSSGLTLYRQQNRVETILQRIRSRKKAQLALMEQLHSLEKLQWPALDCKNVPWAHHRFSCKLHGWSALRSTQDHLSLAPPVDNEQGNGKEIMDSADNESSVNVRDETESAREDGELPSLGHAAVNDTKFTPRGSRLAHTRQLALMAKSISPLTKSKAMSFKKQDDELDILLDLDSDLEEPSPTDQEMEDTAAFQMQRQKSLEKAWFNYGVKEFCLVLTSKVDGGDGILKLEAKIKISMEYPLRPPLFSLSIEYGLSRGNRDSGEDFQWSDKLRAMEAEVNLNMFNILPVEQENKTLAHQVHFLGMMLDYLVDEMSPTSEKSEATSIIDFGLCKPVSGKLLARSVRGRDRRKIIPWKH